MSIKNTILAKIKKEHIEPLSISAVMRRKYLMMFFSFLLIGLGIFIVSFFLSDISWLGELLEMDTIYVIFIWIIAIILLWIFIYRDSRTIGTLYRYSMMKILGGILGIMILGWSLLYFSGIDHSIQKFLVRYTGYENIMSTYAYWDNPEQWRLIGEIIEISSRWLIIEDRWDTLWNIVLAKGVFITQSDNDYGGGIEIGKTIKISWVLEWSGIFTASGISVLFE